MCIRDSCMTVTLQEAVISGCCVTEAVIVALPFFTAVTTPFLLTFATEVSLLFHVTVYSLSLIHIYLWLYSAFFAVFVYFYKNNFLHKQKLYQKLLPSPVWSSSFPLLQSADMADYFLPLHRPAWEPAWTETFHDVPSSETHRFPEMCIRDRIQA